MAYTLDEVVDTLIAECRRKHIEVTSLKLQKLLYYAQAWHLVLHGKPLFREDFEAWIHGPVIPSVFRRFKAYRWNEIMETVAPLKDQDLVLHLREVLKIYGDYTPNQIERLTHSEMPWKEARHGKEPDESSNEIIPKQRMKEFYSGLLNYKEKTASRNS